MAEKQHPISIPTGHSLGEFANYQAATDFVNKLIEGDFAAAKISIIGSDIRLVERVRGRLGYGRVALGGALTGIWIGLLLAILFGAGIEVTPDNQINYVPERFIAAVVIGIGMGMLINILRFSFSKNRRNFVSAPVSVAQSYQVVVPNELADAAREALAKVNRAG
jgi:hypothetical protein